MRFILLTRSKHVVVSGSFIAPMVPPPEIVSWGSRFFHRLDEFPPESANDLESDLPESVKVALEDGTESVVFYCEGMMFALVEGATCHLDIYSTALQHEINDNPNPQEEEDDDQTDSNGDPDGSTTDDPEG
jgi:hypothetical protein